MLKERMKIERHEAMHGPHFDEKFARKAVSKMENEDGSRGEHWSIEEAAQLAQQYGVNVKGGKFNKYDWYVALNMIRSDYYRAIVTMCNSDHIKHFIELAKAWLNDKDIEEGKMWYYFCYVMCDEMREQYEEDDDDDDEEEYEHRSARGRRMARGSRMAGGRYARGGRYGHHGYEEDDEEDYYSHETRYPRYNIRMSRY